MPRELTTPEKKLIKILAHPTEYSHNDIARILNDILPKEGGGTRSGSGVAEFLAREEGRRYVPPRSLDMRKLGTAGLKRSPK